MNQIKKIDILLILLSTSIALVLGLFLIRYFQPSLLGISNDMVIVKSNDQVVPYYENIFNDKDFLSNEFILKDPYVKGRARQFYPDLYGFGPNDLLGFRNESVPNYSDIIIIGDSQTYGNNAHMRENWPHYFSEFMPKGLSVYSMATGGWGAIQYYYAALKALIFKPKLIIIAFYTGNDSLETFSMSYAKEEWNKFISDPSLKNNDVPKIVFPAPKKEQWQLKFSDGVNTVFTPTLRNSSNMKHPAINAGYISMLKIAKKIAKFCKDEKIKIAYTIIPTKEYVYSKKINNEKIIPPDAYIELIENEGARIKQLSDELKLIDNVIYINVVESLREAAIKSASLYPADTNGHPVNEGYKVIGKTIAMKLNDLIGSPFLKGLYLVKTENNQTIITYVQDGRYWFVELPQKDVNIAFNQKVETASIRQLQGLVYSGHKGLENIPGLSVQ